MDYRAYMFLLPHAGLLKFAPTDFQQSVRKKNLKQESVSILREFNPLLF